MSNSAQPIPSDKKQHGWLSIRCPTAFTFEKIPKDDQQVLVLACWLSYNESTKLSGLF